MIKGKDLYVIFLSLTQEPVPSIVPACDCTDKTVDSDRKSHHTEGKNGLQC